MNPYRKSLALLAALALAATRGVVPLAAQDAPKPPAAATEATQPSDAAEPKKAAENTPRKPDSASAKSHGENPVLSVGKGDRVKAGQTVSELVVVFGDGTVDGSVDGDAVVIGGKLVVNGKVGGDVVNVGQGIELGPNSVVDGNVAGIGGEVIRREGSVVHGEIIPIGLSQIPGFSSGIPEWIWTYGSDCLMKLRPLSFTVVWPWTVLAAFFFLHFLVAALLPGASRGVEKAMTSRPGSTVLMAVLAIPLGLFAMMILTVTAVGPVILLAAGLVAILVGKVAVLQFLGGRLTSVFGAGRPPALVCFLIGAVLAAVLYATPFIGFFVWFALSLWSLGAVLIALLRRESTPATAAAPVTNPATGHEPSVVQASLVPVETFPAASPAVAEDSLSPGFAAAAATSSNPSIPMSFSEPPRSSASTANPTAASPSFQARASDWAKTATLPGLDASEIETLPRPTFLPRFGALLLDWILIGVVMGLIPDRIFLINVEDLTGPLRLVLGVTYYAGMIAWRGTTLGGLLLRLQVIRLDGKPLDRATAIVRAVGAILSGVLCGLGWFWALWDEDKQGWHDKFAGTVVVQVTKSKPLI
jgi:uncharacterized RDD family membrane protein YckC